MGRDQSIAGAQMFFSSCWEGKGFLLSRILASYTSVQSLSREDVMLENEEEEEEDGSPGGLSSTSVYVC